VNRVSRYPVTHARRCDLTNHVRIGKPAHWINNVVMLRGIAVGRCPIVHQWTTMWWLAPLGLAVL